MSTAEQNMPVDTSTQRTTATIVLEQPIERGGERIQTLVLRKPRAGELRGLSLTELMQMKTDAVMDLLPRISQPTLIKTEVLAMEPADLLTCAMEVATFLAPRAITESLPK